MQQDTMSASVQRRSNDFNSGTNPPGPTGSVTASVGFNMSVAEEYIICSFSSFFPAIFILAAMETSQPLSIESFSYSWLVNLKPSLDGLDSSLRGSLDAYDEASFIEMDPRMPPSRRFFGTLMISSLISPFHSLPSPLSMPTSSFPKVVSCLCVMPFFVNNSKKIEAYDVSGPTPTLPTAPHAPDLDVPQCKTNRHPSLRRCRRAESIDPRGHVRKNWLYSTGTSPRISVAYSADECRKSCDSESSIYEAVLHCKNHRKMNGREIIRNPHEERKTSGVKYLIDESKSGVPSHDRIMCPNCPETKVWSPQLWGPRWIFALPIGKKWT
ncbi:hypothetical protein F3Y22_tig00013773pilonHSYRG00031 [Hibiscus syriacus]|uniref:Uncharacterized protein n=1 Tax=Hibiscus syriacus TaxID=106335 RepID=A0A6A3C0U1_HIBSY|nr:hypothetical protein F3Y22_tig00013773pilonHSYRG00031 [Hibiscus syriacus]